MQEVTNSANPWNLTAPTSSRTRIPIVQIWCTNNLALILQTGQPRPKVARYILPRDSSVWFVRKHGTHPATVGQCGKYYHDEGNIAAFHKHPVYCHKMGTPVLSITIYSQPGLQRSPLGVKNSNLCRQVASLGRFSLQRPRSKLAFVEKFCWLMTLESCSGTNNKFLFYIWYIQSQKFYILFSHFAWLLNGKCQITTELYWLCRHYNIYDRYEQVRLCILCLKAWPLAGVRRWLL